MSRRWLIIASATAHAGLALGIFISGVWKVEKLDYEHRASLTIGAMMPPGEAGGGEGEEAKKPEPKKEKKKAEKRKVVTDVQPPEERPQETPAEVVPTGGGGDGDGEGPDVGPGKGGGGGGSCDPMTDPFQCQGPPQKQAATCGNGIVEQGEACDGGADCDATCAKVPPPAKPSILPPALFTGLRISGETQIAAPDPTKTAMLRDGRDRVTGSFKVCIDTSGAVSSIAPVGGGTHYAEYDQKLVSAMRAWRYRPYLVNQTPVAACSVVTFVYTIK